MHTAESGRDRAALPLDGHTAGCSCQPPRCPTLCSPGILEGNTVGGVRAKMKRRNNGELENAVLTALWDRGEPMSVSELQAGVSPPKPAYTTMMTVLTRMEDKGLISRERVSRTLMISPVHSQVVTAASEMSRTLRGSTDSHEVLMSFVGSLDDDEIEVLRSFVSD